MADIELDQVIVELKRLDPNGERTARIIRYTFDQLYDGQHTGRYRWDQLHKTEKTHCGTLVEINLQREFLFEDGEKLDFKIRGIEVDCKFSQTLGGWMIPSEALGHICILITASDQDSEWSLGAVRIEEEILNRSSNRDNKRTISQLGRERISWLFKIAKLQTNILLHLPRQIVDTIMDLPSGQKRIDAIFRVAQRTIIGRGVIATLGQQDDFMKRVRGNGGSRSRLKAEGIIILGHYEEHRRIARALNLSEPEIGELISVRIVPADSLDSNFVVLNEVKWRVANPDDPIVAAPEY